MKSTNEVDPTQAASQNSTEGFQWRVMVIDDDENQIKILTKALESAGYQVSSFTDGEAALAKVNEVEPHLLILDINMPGLDGFGVLRELRSSENYLSVFFLSGKSEAEDVVKGLDFGADDYLCKPYDLRELMARVRVQLRLNHLRQQLKEANQKLSEQVEMDELTGLFNMRSMYKRLEDVMIRAQRYQRYMAVIMIDMDHFKKVNDKHGHVFGSFVISEVGRLIGAELRQTDLAARYGGDEFLIVLTETKPEGVEFFCDRLRMAIGKQLYVQGEHKESITVSVGAVTVMPETYIQPREIVKKADRALYQAKDRGRNCVVVDDLTKPSFID